MADHEVRLSTNGLLIDRIDLDFDVKIDGKVLGTLKVSEGGLEWRPKHGRRRGKHITRSWKQFADWAEGDA
ncbi:hypothetical protein C5E51_34425 [Nocardia nova]|uniref:hypothetical protein n=1 Tax=Nocardia nova TaxID=37330 RepID=UPI000CEA4CF3|nr:hypothetical protein [Nocardia nova]PPJ01214.1 hypothetical protein C5E51_34425 [Nocardia nova]